MPRLKKKKKKKPPTRKWAKREQHRKTKDAVGRASDKRYHKRMRGLFFRCYADFAGPASTDAAAAAGVEMYNFVVNVGQTYSRRGTSSASL